jgi:carbonic anhydrase
MSRTVSIRVVAALLALGGLTLVVPAHAAGTGDPTDEAADPGEGKEPSLKPHLRPNLKAAAEAAKSSEAASRSDSASDAKDVSMSELRDMIDKKIAEVRAKREAPPVLKVEGKSKAVKHSKREARAAHPAQAASAASVAAATGHGVMGRDLGWAYSGETGPDNWARLQPDYQTCRLGKRQSPIDIRDGIPVQLDPIQFDYHPSSFRVIDNGHTVQVNVDAGNSITVQGHRYELVQFHFHRPSENRINGRQYAMEVDLVHRDVDGKQAVVAVMLDPGKSQPIVQQVWNNLPLERNQEQQAMTQMDVSQMLPEQRQYATFMGSLTSPPCTEGVLWLVLKNPVQASREQLDVFGKLYQMNARPTQPLAGRLIKDGQ